MALRYREGSRPWRIRTRAWAPPPMHRRRGVSRPSSQSDRRPSDLRTNRCCLVVVGALLSLELDEELLGLPDAVLVGGVDVGGGDLALLGVDEGLGLLVGGQAGDDGEGGGGDGLVDL